MHEWRQALRAVTLAAGVMAACSGPALADSAAAIRARLLRWADDFNAGRKAEICDLFSKDLISDYRGQGEANYTTRCRLLARAIDDPAREFRYVPEIKEVIVEGDLAMVRLDWTLTVTPGDIKVVEPGMDIFRKETDGQWRIIRFMAYEEEGPAR
ncbi:nuclear transport factor 2 family protein [Mesorhizobium sp. BR1-1-16]|uniref:YybH family protein n=1 Tax=Mesorhizobium sp. BR1-1-16 TaxID=2876653 RepID=UPI001CCD4B28|nr:nuclear transport factor 2 family protein [Mesorhizobium sp. BR1-1-16]MBZ9934771.1 nuclear transport factor 2 family protein [Mesorhizobium sp. BR1-1-16]